MGERKGVNKYYPPDFDYKKHGNLDRYHGVHPLRERASKISQGILIIRFEMPYNIWCEGCNSHIGMGVRYNAEKKKIGKYYTTIIYKFRMKCHLCDQYFEIQTDPANCDYKILSGARRKEERWDMEKNEQILTTDHDVKKKLMSDPMFKLEHEKNDVEKMKMSLPTLQEIKDSADLMKEDFLLHRTLRKSFREEKKKLEQKDNLKKKFFGDSNIQLLDVNDEDIKMSKFYKYLPVKKSTKTPEELRKSILEKPIFQKKEDAKSKVIQMLSKRSSSISVKTPPKKKILVIPKTKDLQKNQLPLVDYSSDDDTD